MAVISMKQLLEAGVHFGHQTRRWNPKMKKYIFTERNGIYIIDLQKTVKKMDEAYNFVRDLAADGGQIMFVGTKKQAQEAMKEEASRVGMFYVNHRWLGGTLTNFDTIQKRVAQLKNIERMEEDGTFDVLPKKEVSNLRKQKEKLEKFLGGIKEMKRMPDAMFIVDPRKERIAVAEARKLNIPIVAMCDTNCDPDEIDYVIPSNDDAIRAVKLISARLADAVIEGRQGEDYTAEMTGEAIVADGEATTVAETPAVADEAAAIDEVPVVEAVAEESVAAVEAPVVEETPTTEEEAAPKKKTTRKKKEAEAEAPVVEETPTTEEEAVPEKKTTRKKKEAVAEEPVVAEPAAEEEASKKKATRKKKADAEEPTAEAEEAPKKKATRKKKAEETEEAVVETAE